MKSGNGGLHAGGVVAATAALMLLLLGWNVYWSAPSQRQAGAPAKLLQRKPWSSPSLTTDPLSLLQLPRETSRQVAEREAAKGETSTGVSALPELSSPQPDSAVELTFRARRLSRLTDVKGTYGGGGNLYPAPVEYGMDLERMEQGGGEYLAFVGVFSVGAVSGIRRRDVCRRTWFPSTEEALTAYEMTHNVKMRFVIGKENKTGLIPPEILEEEQQHGEFLHINVKEVYPNLKLKMMRYFTTVPKLFNARYYLKVDDDTYFRPDRVPHAVPQWTAREGDFIGCSMKGGDMFPGVTHRYYEPHRHMVHGAKYYLYFAGPAYAMSRWAVSLLASVPDGGLRFWGAGDASFGAWMLAFNTTHIEDRRMCSNNCGEINILALWGKCNGLCNSAKAMPQSHKDTCGTEPTIPRGMAELPWKPWNAYNSTKEKCHQIHDDWLDHTNCNKP
mmetsp:Transcript_40085/g.71947  ORF Transcript_40085/g.71947 Transcript_40085/m.71947 type:complete len:445 (-) Transcript_40085:100-1434(-)